MLFTISGKHIEITEAIREHAREKTLKLPKYYDSINQVEVIIDGSEGGNISVDDEGRISVNGDEVGQLKIVTIGNLKGLKKAGNQLFKHSGLGVVEKDAEGIAVQQGYLERSNVNGIKALTFMIASLRLFETYQKVIIANDRANEASINEVGKPV